MMFRDVFLALLPVLLAAQPSAAPTTGKPKGKSSYPRRDPLLAVLSGVPIRESGFQTYLAGLGVEQRTRIEASPEQREAALVEFLDQRVMVAKARKEGIELDPVFKKACEMIDLNLLVQAIQKRDRPALLEGLEVSEAEARADYDADVARFKVDQVFTARQILIYVKGNPNFPHKGLEEAKAKAKAEEALARLRAGEGWEAVALAYSDDFSTKTRGGLMQGASFGYHPSAMERALRAQALRVLGEPVRSEFGYHLIQVEARTVEGERQPFEKVKALIQDRLLSAKRAARNKARLDPMKEELGLQLAPPIRPGEPVAADPLLATLGSTAIHDSDFQWFLRDAYPAKQRLDINAQPKVRQEMMQSYLNLRVLEAKARKEGLDLMETFKQTRSAAQEGLLVEFLMGRMNEAFHQEAMPTEDEQKAYYQQNPDRFRPIPWFSARQVLVSVKSQSNASEDATEDARAKARAEEALNRLKAGESWTTIAETFSDDPATKNTDGLMKHASFSSLAPELEQVVRTQGIGKPAGPVRSTLGYHVIQVEMRVTETDVEPFETVRAAIMKHLSSLKFEEAQKAYIVRLRSEMGLVRKDSGSRVHPRVPPPRRQS